MDPLYRAFFTNPGFNGWMKNPCSLCKKYHPADCGIVNDPNWQKAIEEYAPVAQLGRGNYFKSSYLTYKV